jgi:hypothetical protein
MGQSMKIKTFNAGVALMFFSTQAKAEIPYPHAGQLRR